MGVAVLNPQDCLKNSMSRQALISPPRTPNPNRAAQQKRRKRSPNKSPQPRATVSSKLPTRNISPENNNNNNSKSQKLVMGQVRILKRGEYIKEAAPIKAKSYMNLGSSEKFGPDPESVKEVRLARLGPVNGFYAGSAFFTSPPPSSLPLPAFFTKKTTTVKHDDATSDLCRILNLSLD